MNLLNVFLKVVTPYLAEKGIILLLFSSLTGKDKIDELIESNGLESEELCRKFLPFFEKLYVYRIRKSELAERTGIKKDVSDV